MFQRFSSILTRSVGIRQSAILTSGNLFATILSAIGLILVSRELGPTRFAEFSAGYSLLVIITKLSNLGITVALPQFAGSAFQKKGWHSTFINFLRLTTLLLSSVTAILLLIGMIAAPWVATSMGFTSVNSVRFAFACAAITIWFEYFASVFQSFHRFLPAAAMMIVQASWKLAVALIIVTWAPNLAITTLFLIFYLSPGWGVLLTLPWFPYPTQILTPAWHTAAWRSFRRIAPHGAVLVATTGVLEYVDVLYLQRWGSAYDTGLYGGVVQIASLSFVVAYSLSGVLSARVARYRKASDLKAYRQKALALSALLLFAGLATVPLVPLVITLSIGPAYLPAAPYLSWMLLAGILTIATVPLAAMFYAYDRPWYFSLTGLLQLGLMLGGGYLLIPTYGIWGAVTTRLLTRGAAVILTLGWIVFEERKRHSRA